MHTTQDDDGWYLVNGDGERVAGPFRDKLSALEHMYDDTIYIN